MKPSIKPPIPAPGAGGSQLEGQGLRAEQLLAQLDEACRWVHNIKRVTKRESYTELALQLYKFLVGGVDENGVWRDYVIQLGKADPEQLNAFVNSFDALKTKSIERVTAVCRKVYNTELVKASDLHLRLPARLARKTVGQVLEEGIKGQDEEMTNVKTTIDFSWLYETLCREIRTLSTVGLGIYEHNVDNMLECLFECPPW